MEKPAHTSPKQESVQVHPVILFDGVCNLCNASVNYVIDHDPEGRFKLAALQSEAARALLQQGSLSGEHLDSIVLIEGPTVYTESTAALRIARSLAGPARLLWPLVFLPRGLRDSVYRWVAQNRYRWFGKSENCRVPTPEIKARFLLEESGSPR